MRRVLLLAVVAAALLASGTEAESDVTPTIVVYTGTDSGFAEMLADLVNSDERIGSVASVVTSPEIVTLATSLPQTECIVIYSANKVELEGLEASLMSFLEQGGGLIGMREACYEPSVGRLAQDVFPVFANWSVKQLNPQERRVRTYVEADPVETITEGLPQEFALISMGTYFPADGDGNYLPIPGDYEVPYKDLETGSPLIVAYENENGGRSISFPGVWTIPTSRLDIYYGNLVADENFVKLFTNSVLWAAKGSTRFEKVQEDIAEKIEDARTRTQRLRDEAERARKREATQRILMLAGVWIAGLIACAVIVRNLILAPLELEE